MHRKYRFEEKQKFIECRISWNLIGKFCTLDRESEVIEKFEFGEYMISWKFNRKLSTIDVQKDRIHEEKKVKFIEWTKLSKFKGKLGALDG